MEEKESTFVKPSILAFELAAHPATIYNLIKQNKVPHVEIGGMIRIPRTFLDQLKEQARASGNG